MRTQLISNSTPDGSAPQAPKHKSVLLQEVLEALQVKPSDIVFDGTLGSAGHAKEFIKRLGKNGVFIGSDLDKKSLQIAKEQISVMQSKCKVLLFQGNFKDIKKFLEKANLTHINKALLDLGWSKDQFEDFGKGFSFLKDEPLDMRFDESQELSAYEIVNFWSEETLADIIFGFGQERKARQIAKVIVAARQKKPISSSRELAKIVSQVFPKRYFKINPATKTFQALRIAVNSELEVLKEALENIENVLAPEGRLAVISFHSLEDRIVKNTFKNWVKEAKGTLLNKKPIVPSAQEIKENKSARSAKLRVYEKKQKEANNESAKH